MRKSLEIQLSEKVSIIARAVQAVGNQHDFGHAFIWGSVPVIQKNGKTKYVKTCITSVCSDDLPGCVKKAQEYGCLNVFYNLD
jgi:hypothetical protein